MENIKHCAVVVRRPQDVWEGTRTALGLAAHNYWAYEALEENLEWLEEMECETYSNLRVNEQHGFKYIPLDKLARELKKMDLVIPFGNRVDPKEEADA